MVFISQELSNAVHEVIAIPLTAENNSDGEDIQLISNENLDLLSVLLKERLPKVFLSLALQYA
jgi:hypothetical protein